MGIKVGTLRGIENARNAPGLDIIEKICSTFPDKTTWIMTGQGALPTLSNSDNAIHLGFYDLSASMGKGEAIFEQPTEESLTVTEESLGLKLGIQHYKDDNLFLFTVAGDSMQPKVGPDDICLAKRSEVKEEDGIYLLDTPDGIMCKRLIRQGDKVIVRSDNKEYEDWIPNDPAEIIIRARVISILKQIKT